MSGGGKSHVARENNDGSRGPSPTSHIFGMPVVEDDTLAPNTFRLGYSTFGEAFRGMELIAIPQEGGGYIVARATQKPSHGATE